jgi:hypothetical protein
MDWGIVVLLAMVIPFSIWAVWVSGRGETRKRHLEADRTTAD